LKLASTTCFGAPCLPWPPVIVAAQWLRKKGLAGADKKAGRLAAEGVIAAYIHPGSRLGVLLEVNCETDFVAASDKFNALVNSIAMQIAASPSVSHSCFWCMPAEEDCRLAERCSQQAARGMSSTALELNCVVAP
jgi:translation elongation factor EF-Ts